VCVCVDVCIYIAYGKHQANAPICTKTAKMPSACPFQPKNLSKIIV